jgi:hypothetical protein
MPALIATKRGDLLLYEKKKYNIGHDERIHGGGIFNADGEKRLY